MSWVSAPLWRRRGLDRASVSRDSCCWLVLVGAALLAARFGRSGLARRLPDDSGLARQPTANSQQLDLCPFTLASLLVVMQSAPRTALHPRPTPRLALTPAARRALFDALALP